MCNQISSNWPDAINNRKDFNAAMQKTLQIAENGGVLKTLRDDKKSIENAMSKLNEPPEQYKDLYNKLLSFRRHT